MLKPCLELASLIGCHHADLDLAGLLWGHRQVVFYHLPSLVDVGFLINRKVKFVLSLPSFLS